MVVRQPRHHRSAMVVNWLSELLTINCTSFETRRCERPAECEGSFGECRQGASMSPEWAVSRWPWSALSRITRRHYFFDTSPVHGLPYAAAAGVRKSRDTNEGSCRGYFFHFYADGRLVSRDAELPDLACALEECAHIVRERSRFPAERAPGIPTVPCFEWQMSSGRQSSACQLRRSPLGWMRVRTDYPIVPQS